MKRIVKRDSNSTGCLAGELIYVIAGKDDSLVGSRCQELLNELLEPSQRTTGFFDAEADSVSIQEVLDELKKCTAEIDTVFSVGLIDKVSDGGLMENYERARQLGYHPSINAKVNIGVGRPQAKF